MLTNIFSASSFGMVAMDTEDYTTLAIQSVKKLFACLLPHPFFPLIIHPLQPSGGEIKRNRIRTSAFIPWNLNWEIGIIALLLVTNFIYEGMNLYTIWCMISMQYKLQLYSNANYSTICM